MSRLNARGNHGTTKNPNQSRNIEYIYAVANTGASSGGHTALKLGSLVYHYQHYPDEIFRLIRQDWRPFRHVYILLENRTLHIAKLKVKPSEMETLRTKINQAYLLQEIRLERLRILKEAYRFYMALKLAKTESKFLDGSGFFVQSGHDSIGEGLRDHILEGYPSNFMQKKLSDIEARIATFHGFQFPEAKAITPFSLGHLPEHAPYQNLKELLLLREAYLILQEGRALRADAIFDPEKKHVRPGYIGTKRKLIKSEQFLSITEKKILLKFSHQLQNIIHDLIRSNRSNYGYPLLIAIARYGAVQHSLRSNRLMLLDPYPDHARVVPATAIKSDARIVHAIAKQAFSEYRIIRKKIFSTDKIDESSYNLIENAAARAHELKYTVHTNNDNSSTVGTHGTIRIAEGRMIPSRARIPSASYFRSLRKQMKYYTFDSAQYSKAHLRNYQQHLKGFYGYNIFRNNCTTKLLQKIDNAMENSAKISKLRPKHRSVSLFDFIPFVSYNSIKSSKRFLSERTILSRRREGLKRLYKTQGSISVFARESNTLTSRLYGDEAKDFSFLFFTDEIVWNRPLLGIFNLTYGILYAIAGIIDLPYDNGEAVLTGLKGAMFSLPEIVFFNIRKGSYEYAAPLQTIHIPAEAK